MVLGLFLGLVVHRHRKSTYVRILETFFQSLQRVGTAGDH